MSRVMLDLETLGNKPGSVIVAIGAVKFDQGAIVSSFYERVDAESCVALGLRLDVSTVMWWLQQDAAARLEITKQGKPLSEALVAFSSWLGGDVDEMWGNGAAFDNVLLADAYVAAQLPRPWPFWIDRCYRTVRALHPDIRASRTGVAHNALDDAKSQALHLMAMID